MKSFPLTLPALQKTPGMEEGLARILCKQFKVSGRDFDPPKWSFQSELLGGTLQPSFRDLNYVIVSRTTARQSRLPSGTHDNCQRLLTDLRAVSACRWSQGNPSWLASD